MKKYDAIVVGSGQAGTPLSKKLAKAGLKTALIERRWIGGTCVNDGCTPTKTMVASARLAYRAATAAKLGINIPDYQVDLPEIIARKNDIVHQFRNGSQSGLEKTENLDIIFGNATFTGNKLLEVKKENGEVEQLSAEHIFINVGTHTFIPDIPGLKDVPFLTSTTILDLETIPKHLVIVGTGYIGLEFGQMFLRFGSKITMIESAPQLMKKEDPDVAVCMEDILANEGITFLKNTKAIEFSGSGENLTVTTNTSGTISTINCSHILIAVGRRPNTPELGLDKTGVEVDDKQFIVVNEYLETTQSGIYAVGDVKGGPEFTHVAYNDYLVVIRNFLENKKISIKDRLVPYCMFTDPQLGRIGMTEHQAREKGLNIKIATLPMDHVARAIETGTTFGKMKAVVDADTKQILGAAIIGEDGGEIMSVLQMAMMGNITHDTIRETMFAHPLYAESLNNLFMNLDN